MHERKYFDLLTVETGERLRVARCESNIAYPGYLVKLDTGDLGTVTRRMFVCEGSDECAFIEDVASVFEVVAVWGQVYTREATHADP